ncbi:hypothetical protein Misp01_21540 [Microtetraspora sp. NBRC 13810]|uniref:hypothetical protein n=1 Tax=Microtetraspora sp. NBRC 13810 TaxID=3030990 RepID=UPI0024A06E39|nr:hypothetical protein [Microtetraspora sp. NBRC 13810]GLW07024.1 hypothetical protein Misp01_21540 [Microtetraspora sp. NBRC 13810]
MTTLNPQILGRAENAHRALLDRTLTGTGLSYHQWVALKITAAGGAGDGLAGKVANALKTGEPAARQAIAGLVAAGLLAEDGPAALTPAGRDLHDRLTAAIDETVTRLYSDVPAGDLAVAGRVLTLITARADAELAR